MIDNIEEWLKQDPDPEDVKSAPGGGFHIPIELLRPLLDKVDYSTRNFHYQLYKHGNDGFAVSASIELEISYTQRLPPLFSAKDIVRTASGACNFTLASIQPIKDFVATAKSQCIKNAAKDLARKFGRDLNIDLPEAVPEAQPKEKWQDATNLKIKPDMRILKSFEEAIKNNDTAAATLLTNIYDIKTD